MQVRGIGKYSRINKTLTFKILPPKNSADRTEKSKQILYCKLEKKYTGNRLSDPVCSRQQIYKERKTVTVGKQSATRYKISGLKNKRPIMSASGHIKESEKRFFTVAGVR